MDQRLNAISNTDAARLNNKYPINTVDRRSLHSLEGLGPALRHLMLGGGLRGLRDIVMPFRGVEKGNSQNTRDKQYRGLDVHNRENYLFNSSQTIVAAVEVRDQGSVIVARGGMA